MTNELENQLNFLIEKEASRIMKILLGLYSKKIRVNKSFQDLVVENLKEEFIPCQDSVVQKATRLIPLDLMVCPTHEFVFITDREFDEFFCEKRLNNIEKNTNKKNDVIDKLCIKIIDNYKNDKLNKKNILEIVNLYTSKKDLKEIDGDILENMIKKIINSINKKYQVTSIDPFNIEGL